ncbi:hypothetical protein EI94DRAFT_1768777 [Lactarius quietus]|nr:hypothetical protein EI94DRAFT_1768777 [Lactarius quietus]
MCHADLIGYQLSKKWDTPIYVFFMPSATMEYVGRCKAHVFECSATCCHCKSKYVWHFLHTGDASLTSNMCWQPKICWGGQNWNGSITSAFKWVGKGMITYSQHVHTKLEAWYTGRPECFILSAESLSCDVKNMFVTACGHIAKMLQEYDGKLNFATDAWTLPNHKAYIAITVHLKHEGKPLSTLLDIVEVPKSHSGRNLVITFAEVLQIFKIEAKV